MENKDQQKGQSVSYLQKLARKVLEGKATEAEKLFLDEYYNLFDSDKNQHDLSEDEKAFIQEDIKNRLQKTLESGRREKIRMFNVYKVAAAVALMIVASIGLYKITDNTESSSGIAHADVTDHPIVHGGNKATLTLSDGSTVVLDGKPSGTLAEQEGVGIFMATDGQIVYSAGPEKTASAGDKFNVMRTPRGGIYQVVLPDGTGVWLNSSTTLRYPLAFSGTERRVELNGEAYFEVAGNKAVPFRVVCEHQTVEVIGTHFNINSYADEEHSKTTLLEGRVKITAANSGESKFLDPGQQAMLRPGSMSVRNVNTDNSIAWKNGLFQFDNEDIHIIMRKISRWYDVEVEYSEDINDLRFGGAVSRFEDIRKVLRKLELTNTVHFKIEGRKIIVMK